MHNSAQRRVGLARVAMAGLLALEALVAPVPAQAQGSNWPGRIEILPVRSQPITHQPDTVSFASFSVHTSYSRTLKKRQ